MITYFSQYLSPQMVSVPLICTEWSPIVNNALNHVYTVPLHPLPICATNSIQPYSCPRACVTKPVINPVTRTLTDSLPVIPDFYEHELIVEYALCSETLAYEDVYKEIPEEKVVEETNENTTASHVDPLELYLKLPRELFPTARMLAIDPNAIIDEFCKLSNIHDHEAWILDLEFGIPRVPVTRVIPFYDVQYNSIHCKNTPSAIHPGFASCDEEFKRVLTFYYDCIVSTWYRGYIAMKGDSSVKNFQKWILMPMQAFGMCWP